MGLLDDWFDTFQSVLTGPSEYFGREQRRDGFGYPLKFAALSFVLAAVFNAARTFTASTPLGGLLPFAGDVLVAVGVLIVSPVVAVIGLFIWSVLVHLFVALLGGEHGYSETLSVYGYATALSPLTALIAIVPVVGGLVNLVLGIYGVYIQARGLENFQELSFGRALAAVLLPGIVLVLLAVVAAVVLGAAVYSAIGSPPVAGP